MFPWRHGESAHHYWQDSNADIAVADDKDVVSKHRLLLRMGVESTDGVSSQDAMAVDRKDRSLSTNNISLHFWREDSILGEVARLENASRNS